VAELSARNLVMGAGEKRLPVSKVKECHKEAAAANSFGSSRWSNARSTVSG
jgi:hypothetical protein